MKTKLTIGHFPIIDHLILGVAKHHDGPYFEHHELAQKLFINWSDMCDALRDGSIDGTFILAPLAMELIRTGVPAKMILLGQREGQVFTAQKSITDPIMLKGKKILVPHLFSMGNILLHRILGSIGLSPADITLQPNFDDVHSIPRWLHEGKIQAFISAEPWGTLATEAGDGYFMAVSQSMHIHHMCCVLVMRDEVIQNFSDAVQELVGSLVKAGMFMNAYPRQTAEIGAKFMGVSEKIALQSLTHHEGHVLFWDLLPRAEDFEEVQRALIDELHLWKEPVCISAYIDTSFAQHAYRAWMIDTRREVKDKGEARVLPGNFKEAAVRFARACKDLVEITGLCHVRAGQRYPKADKEKGFVTFSPDSSREPDQVIIKMSERDAHQCLRALHFGKDDGGGSAIMAKTEDDAYSMDYEVFKFLILLLAHF